MRMKRSSGVYQRSLLGFPEAKETSPPGIPEPKWNEIVNKEENNLFLLGIREEIVNRCLNICYENYLSRQVVAFTVHCAYLAWVKAIGVYYMFRDPGDTDDPKVRESWEPDEEPEPSVIDSWGSQCIKAVKPEPLKKEKDVVVDETVHTLEENTSESQSKTMGIYGEGEGEFYIPNSYSESYVSLPPREKSIFSKTLSMSKDSLLLVEPMAMHECRTVHVPKKGPQRKSIKDSQRMKR